MAKATIIQKAGNNYKLDANGTVVFRSFSRALSNQEENDMLKNVYDKKAGKTKKQKFVMVNGYSIKKNKEKDLLEFIKLKEIEIKNKVDELNV